MCYGEEKEGGAVGREKGAGFERTRVGVVKKGRLTTTSGCFASRRPKRIRT